MPFDESPEGFKNTSKEAFESSNTSFYHDIEGSDSNQSDASEVGNNEFDDEAVVNSIIPPTADISVSTNSTISIETKTQQLSESSSSSTTIPATTTTTPGLSSSALSGISAILASSPSSTQIGASSPIAMDGASPFNYGATVQPLSPVLDLSPATSSIGNAFKEPNRPSSGLSNSGTDLQSVPKIGKIGVCAMDAKARTIENWPTCDFLISFFSTGFPLQKAIDYANLRKPFLVNDIELQKILWDRRLVLRLLEASNVPTPHRVVVSRDGGPRVGPELREKLKLHGVDVQPESELKFEMIGQDILKFEDGRIMKKPFVEKPVDGEDHNVYVYYHSSAGGGGRRLFRKVGNKSSEYDPTLNTPRMDGSFIYEEFMDTDNFEDVKAYTVGPNYCHAETRKSPVVDGVVRRNTYGKEIRFVTKLSEEEIQMASNISRAFEQTICGFDLLRVNGKSYVIDVNGFSFVKDNQEYYNNTAKILRQIFIQAKKDKSMRTSSSSSEAKVIEKEQKWKPKGQIYVIRHADRTPKQKFKFSFKSKIFIDLLRGHKEEVIIREKHDLGYILKVTKKAQEENIEDPAKLAQLRMALEKKKNFPGTKVQLKPVLNKDAPTDAERVVEKVQVIIKWGGEPTHSARYQAMELGLQMRQDALLLNKDFVNNISIYTSSERRVVASAKIWASAYLDLEDVPEDMLSVRKDWLDDSNAAKDLTDKVKKKLKPLLRKGLEPPPQFTWPPKFPEPFVVLSRVVELMNYHKRILEHNYATQDVNTFQSRWCCNEDPELFRERWDKLFKEFVTVEKVDPSKISELYDTMKFDGLHNRQFLEKVFRPDPELGDKFDPPQARFAPLQVPQPPPYFEQKHKKASPGDHIPMSTAFEGPEYAYLRELYTLAKILFDFICPQEYGIEAKEKLDIGLLTSLPLVKQILREIESMQNGTECRSVFYFTKESHIYTLLNVIYESQISTKYPRNHLPELDYLTQIGFEIYETGDKKHSIRLSISPGCNTQNPLDVQLDSKHCISCIPLVNLTRHLDSDLLASKFRSRFARVSLPKKFIPVNWESGLSSPSSSSSSGSVPSSSDNSETSVTDLLKYDNKTETKTEEGLKNEKETK